MCIKNTGVGDIAAGISSTKNTKQSKSDVLIANVNLKNSDFKLNDGNESLIELFSFPSTSKIEDDSTSLRKEKSMHISNNKPKSNVKTVKVASGVINATSKNTKRVSEVTNDDSKADKDDESGIKGDPRSSLTGIQRKTVVDFAREIGEKQLPYNAGSGPYHSGGLWDNDFPEPTVIDGVQKEAMLSCNGLTYWAYKNAGIEIPHGSTDQMIQAPYVTSTGNVSDMSPGDIVVYDYDNSGQRSEFDYSDISGRSLHSPHHVALYLGEGKLVEEVYPCANIRDVKDNEYSYSVTW